MAAYEESRNQRLEQNKRRMEELGLMELSESLKKPKVARKKPEKRKIEVHEARRSSRVAAKPVVIYREQLQKVPGARERRDRQGLRRRYLTEAAREAAVEAAEKLVKNMENPAFEKPMVHSNVSSVFWLGLPVEFCEKHMPGKDEKFMLEDEKEKKWECLYLAHRKGMSSGWRGFALDHDIMDGDCCVFELVGPLRFKVHIVRFEDEEDDEDSDDSDGKKPRSRKAKRLSRSSSARRRFVVEDDEDEDDEDDEEDEEDEEEEEFDSDVCDDHVSDEEEEVDEDSEDDYSPKLSEKEVDTLVAAPTRASRLLKRKIAKVDNYGKENDDDKEDDDDKEESDKEVDDKEESDDSEGHDEI